MDILYFLKSRTAFIRTFYVTAAFPFKERIRKIREQEDPFDDPPYSEDPEPPFLAEYTEADESLEVLGQLCLSMLSNTLHLFLVESVEEVHRRYDAGALAKAGIGRPSDSVPKAVFKKEGWIGGYRAYFRDTLEIDWQQAPCDLGRLEEIALARNSLQHPGDITTLQVEHSANHAAKFPEGYFSEGPTSWLGAPFLYVPEEKLLGAVNEVEGFCSWLWERQFRRRG